MSMADRPLAGQTALVTGGARRLGRVLCRRLAEVGADVAVHYSTSATEARQAVAQLRGLGVKAAAVQATFGKPGAAEALLAQASQAMGAPVTMLVNNASAYPRAALDDLTLTALDRSIATDAWAPLELTRALARDVGSRLGPSLPARAPASVVNLLDTRVTAADWDHMGYHLAKSMLADLTRLCATRYGPLLRVNGVAPGAVLPPEDVPEAGRQELMDKAARAGPLHRNPTPDDVADAVLYLLGAHSVTGQVLFVDGGRHLVRSMV